MVQRKWSKAVEVVFSLTRDIMNGIQDVDGIEKQQQMALDLFKFLGGIKDFEEASKKMMEMAIKVDEEWGKEEVAIGDTVKVMETRPLSKDKRWRLVEIIEKAK